MRPTADRVREAIFNLLAHNDFGCGFDLRGVRVLDLFAGTGALGIEALSRGAAFCLFVDDHFASRGLVRENVERFGLNGVTRIWRRDATALGPLDAGAGGPFGLVFLDPPYGRDLGPRALAGAMSGGWLSTPAIAVVETGAEEAFALPEGVNLIDARRYGETMVRIIGVGTGA